MEHGKSIVENPKRHGKSYNKWLGEQAKPCHRDLLRTAIDGALEKKPADLNALLKLLQEDGCEVTRRGKSISLRAPGWKSAARLDSLKSGYTEDDLLAVLTGKKEHALHKKSPVTAPPKSNLLIDIQSKLDAGKGAGYERWAKVFNLKQMAQTMNYLREHALLDIDTLKEKSDAATAQFNTLLAQIKAAETRMAEIAVLKTQIINYAKTREVFDGYKASKYSKKYLAEHETDILLHRAAKKTFNDLGIKKLPTVKSLQSEYAKLLTEKKTAYADYRRSRDEMRELLTHRANVDKILGADARENEKEKEQERR